LPPNQITEQLPVRQNQMIIDIDQDLQITDVNFDDGGAAEFEACTAEKLRQVGIFMV